MGKLDIHEGGAVSVYLGQDGAVEEAATDDQAPQDPVTEAAATGLLEAPFHAPQDPVAEAAATGVLEAPFHAPQDPVAEAAATGVLEAPFHAPHELVAAD